MYINREPMANFLHVLLLVVFPPFAAGLKPDRYEDWTQSLPQVDHLHFFLHDTLSGKNPTAIQIAQAPSSAGSKTRFGGLFMADDPLTEGSDPNSKLLGRAQGTWGFSDQNELGLIMSMSFSFVEDQYNGSSIVVLGRNPILNPNRELPIVGGTGHFRLARGVAMLRTFSLNRTSGDAIVEYNVTVVH